MPRRSRRRPRRAPRRRRNSRGGVSRLRPRAGALARRLFETLSLPDALDYLGGRVAALLELDVELLEVVERVGEGQGLEQTARVRGEVVVAAAVAVVVVARSRDARRRREPSSDAVARAALPPSPSRVALVEHAARKQRAKPPDRRGQPPQFVPSQVQLLERTRELVGSAHLPPERSHPVIARGYRAQGLAQVDPVRGGPERPHSVAVQAQQPKRDAPGETRRRRRQRVVRSPQRLQALRAIPYKEKSPVS